MSLKPAKKMDYLTAKFVQIEVDPGWIGERDSTLYALDESGRVWYLSHKTGMWHVMPTERSLPK
jgi:hypothetical protein